MTPEQREAVRAVWREQRKQRVDAARAANLCLALDGRPMEPRPDGGLYSRCVECRAAAVKA